MKYSITLFMIIVLTAACVSAEEAVSPEIFRFNELPPLPDELGFGGPFGGGEDSLRGLPIGVLKGRQHGVPAPEPGG